MDEPTNHLDLEVCYALTLALQSFEGSLILVSHDRHLLRNTVDRFLLVADGQVSEFKGDLDDYQTWLTQRRRQDKSDESKTEDTDASSNRSLTAAERKEIKRQQAEQRAALRPLKQLIEQDERKIATLELKLKELEEKLSETDLYSAPRKAELTQHLEAQRRLQKELSETEESWMERLEEYEEKEAALSQMG